MAKAVEDTTFYRYNRLIALNEVGGEPDHYGADVAAFHAEMAIRLEDQPAGLMASSTHDTKRGEDARARLYTISEAPERWAEIVKTAAEAMSAWRKDAGEGLVSPDPATEWGFYQALLGVIPADFDPADETMRKELSERLVAFAQKAARARRSATRHGPHRTRSTRARCKASSKRRCRSARRRLPRGVLARAFSPSWWPAL